MVTQPAPSYRKPHRASSGTISRAPAIALTTRDTNRPHAPADGQTRDPTHRNHRPIERREQQANAAARSRLAPRPQAAIALAITHG